MVQEKEGLPEHIHEDPRLAKIEAVKKKVCCCTVLTSVFTTEQQATMLSCDQACPLQVPLGQMFIRSVLQKLEGGCYRWTHSPLNGTLPLSVTFPLHAQSAHNTVQLAKSGMLNGSALKPQKRQ
jgi:hypothetical protein